MPTAVHGHSSPTLHRNAFFTLYAIQTSMVFFTLFASDRAMDVTRVFKLKSNDLSFLSLDHR